MTKTVSPAVELEMVRRELEFMLDCRLSAGFSRDEHERYGLLLARERLLLLELGQNG